MNSIFFMSSDELVDLYAAHKQGSVHLAADEEMALIEELLSRPPSGPAAWALMDLM
jgi:hypothetical protein